MRTGASIAVIKEEIEKSFSLLITISLFFPVFLANLGILAGKSNTDSTLTLVRVSVLVALYLADYLLFQSRKEELRDRALVWINRVVLIALGIFIIPIAGIAVLSFNPPHWLAWIAAWVSGASMIFVLSGPPALELLIIFAGTRKNAHATKRVL